MSVEFLATVPVAVVTPGSGVICPPSAGRSRGDWAKVVADHRAAGRALRSGVTIDVLNLHLTTFELAVLSQILTPDKFWTVLRMLGLSGVFMKVTLAIVMTYGVIAATVRTHVVYRPRGTTWMRRSFAAVVGLGARHALTGR